MTDIQDRFSGVVEAARTTLEQADSVTRTVIDTLQKDVEQSIEGDRESYARYLEQAHNDGEGLIEELRRLLSIASDESLSANYGNQAAREDKRSTRLRAGAIVFGVLTVAAAVVSIVLQDAVLDESSGSEIWSLWPGKLAMIGTLAALAGYLGREASRHRTYAQELRAKQSPAAQPRPVPERA